MVGHFCNWRITIKYRGLNFGLYISAAGDADRPGDMLHQDGQDREGVVWGGLQGTGQRDEESGGHQNHRPGRGRRRNRGHPTGDHGLVSVR